MFKARNGPSKGSPLTRTKPHCVTMGSGHKNSTSSKVTSDPITSETRAVTIATTQPALRAVTAQSLSQRKRPPLPSFLPVTPHVNPQGCENHGESTPVTLQSILHTITNQSDSIPRHYPGKNAGLPFFPTSPLNRKKTSEIGTQIPSLKSPLHLLSYAASLKKGDNIHALEEALGFLKAFSEHVCAAKSSAGSTESTTTDNKPSTATCKSAESTLQIPGSPRNQHGRDVRPKSFLREEMDEFDRIFSELLLFSPGKKFSDYINVEEEGEESSEQCLEAETIFSYDTDKMEKMNKSGAKSHEHTSCDKCKGAYNVDGCNSSDCTELCKLSPRSQSCPCGHSISDSSSPAKGVSPDTGQGDPVVSPGKVLWDDNDKLFTQLLDDLDNITGDTPSVRRRKKARDLFSNWLFSEDSKSPEHPVKRCKEVFRDLAKRRSVDLDTRKQQQDLYTRWRPRSFEYLSEDDADSGYHTGSSTLTSRGPRGAKRPPGEWTLTREDLRRNIETFNNNNHGLIMSLQQDTNTFQGFIRVHMNLIRPINMSLSLRPPSIYDVIGQGEEEDEHNDGTHTTSFYLPKDTTKVIHINSDTTAQEVIKALLSKFKITDNPRKFALYERLEESSNKATMRRLEDEECPLPLCLCWTADGVEGLDCRRYVLQENDTGEIMWEAFSLPELENFLKILNREEEEYVEQVKGKYRMLKIHMQRRLVELDNKPTEETTLTDDKRRPVFV